jgi:hypothetical protein
MGGGLTKSGTDTNGKFFLCTNATCLQINILSFDFFADGNVNEDVFVYSNCFESQQSLTIYHNKYANTQGWIKISAAALDKGSGKLRQVSLADALQLPYEGYAVFRDYVDHLEYIRSCSEIREKGIYAELGSYQCHVFLDWRFVTGEQWREVCKSLNGSGAPSIQARKDEMIAAAHEKDLMHLAVIKKKAPKMGGNKASDTDDD